MTPIDINQIVFEVVKAAILGASGWLLKLHTDVRAMRRDLDCAFTKIRDMETSAIKLLPKQD